MSAQGKPVAIKVLKEHMAQKEIMEFKKEFDILWCALALSFFFFFVLSLYQFSLSSWLMRSPAA
jgi:hypothetical protein